jgi:DNA repair exonuclease SbcCD ATPase subunit
MLLGSPRKHSWRFRMVDRDQTRRDAKQIERVLRGTLGTHEAVLEALDALARLLSELDQADARETELKSLLERRSNDADNMLDLYTKAEARLAKVPALERYIQHLPTCPRTVASGVCTCGLDAALAGWEQE